jgi:hypothetical protein
MEKPSSARIALKFGLIFAIISIASTTIFYTTDLWTNYWLIFIFSIITTVLMQYLAMSEYKKFNGGFMTYGEGLGLGTLAVATSSVFSLIYDSVYKKFIDPGIMKKTLEMTEEQYEKIGMPEEQITEAVQRVENWSNSGLSFLVGIIVAVLIGFIVALIVSAVLKKDKPVFS